jgi:hypothetical protein
MKAVNLIFTRHVYSKVSILAQARNTITMEAIARTTAPNAQPFVIQSGLGTIIVKAVIFTCWSEADFKAYSAALLPALDENRRRHKRARLLVDRRHAPVQSQSIHIQIRELMENFLAENDAVALLVSSSLVTLQSQRIALRARGCVFRDEESAIAWLKDC